MRPLIPVTLLLLLGRLGYRGRLGSRFADLLCGLHEGLRILLQLGLCGRMRLHVLLQFRMVLHVLLVIHQRRIFRDLGCDVGVGA